MSGGLQNKTAPSQVESYLEVMHINKTLLFKYTYWGDGERSHGRIIMDVSQPNSKSTGTHSFCFISM